MLKTKRGWRENREEGFTGEKRGETERVETERIHIRNDTLLVTHLHLLLLFFLFPKNYTYKEIIYHMPWSCLLISISLLLFGDSVQVKQCEIYYNILFRETITPFLYLCILSVWLDHFSLFWEIELYWVYD